MPEWLRRWQRELGDPYALGLVRLVLGVLLFWHALDRARELAQRGYFGDVFHLPWIAEVFVPSRIVYTAMVAAMLVLAALVIVGHRARSALCASALLSVYALLCNRLEFHHNRYALACFAFVLSFAPCDRSFVLAGPALGSVARIGPLWAQRLAQCQLALIYLASGASKLLDDDWRSGLVIGDRILRHADDAVARGVPLWLVEWGGQPFVASTLSRMAIGTELFLAVGLFPRRTRVFALWWGVVFHLTIELTSHVEQFTWISLAIYALFATPDVRARKLFFDPTRAKGLLYARLVAGLDWLARFEIRPWAPDGFRKGHSIVVVRRDGSRATGLHALVMVVRCVPLLFPLWAPLALFASFTKRGETSARV